MITVDELTVGAPPMVTFQVAADVESWPRILPHYRWVRFRDRETFGTGRVEMAAYRPFGPLGYPTWWVSDMMVEPDSPRILYHHVDGITRGMDVRWEFRPAGDGTHVRIVHEWRGPAWPFIGPLAANLVIGPVFISAIASRTLAGVGLEAERRAAVASRDGE